MDICSLNPLIPFEQALARLLENACPITQTESVPLEAALGKVLGAPLGATVNNPPFDSSAMDGYALRCADLNGLDSHTLPISQYIRAGDSGHALSPQTAARIFTGATLPDGADCVVPQELCEQNGNAVTINAVPRVGDNIRETGTHIRSGQIIIEKGCLLQPQHIGLAASAGISHLTVFKPLTVGLVSSGNELRAPGETLTPGTIYNSNHAMLKALLTKAPCKLIDYGTLKDDLDATQALLGHAAAECDVLISSGGASVGDEDHLKQAISSQGALKLWKLAIKPGKPLAFGQVGSMAVVALPGNPVASFVTYALFARPFLYKTAGCNSVKTNPVQIRAAFDRKKNGVRREFLRARLEIDETGVACAIPYSNQDSATLASLTATDGLIAIPENRSVSMGDILDFYPYAMILD